MEDRDFGQSGSESSGEDEAADYEVEPEYAALLHNLINRSLNTKNTKKN